MSTHIVHSEKECFYFVTFTCYKWLNLFEEANIYDYLEFWFKKLKEKGCLLNGYVIMPNHMHLILYVKEEVEDFNKCIAESKRFLAYEIVKRLRQANKHNLLNILQSGVQKNELKNGKKHQVFRLSFDARKLDEMGVVNVLNYIHQNPVMGKWNLIDDYINYPYSSSGFYENGDIPKYGLVDFRDTLSESSTSDSEVQ